MRCGGLCDCHAGQKYPPADTDSADLPPKGNSCGIRKAKADGFLGTDDASVAEHSGFPVRVIMGSYRNIKITTKEDLLIGAAFLKEETE